MAELIHHFNQYDCVEEAELFNIVQQVVVAHAINPTLPHANELIYFVWTNNYCQSVVKYENGK